MRDTNALLTASLRSRTIHSFHRRCSVVRHLYSSCTQAGRGNCLNESYPAATLGSPFMEPPHYHPQSGSNHVVVKTFLSPHHLGKLLTTQPPLERRSQMFRFTSPPSGLERSPKKAGAHRPCALRARGRTRHPWPSGVPTWETAHPETQAS